MWGRGLDAVGGRCVRVCPVTRVLLFNFWRFGGLGSFELNSSSRAKGMKLDDVCVCVCVVFSTHWMVTCQKHGVVPPWPLHHVEVEPRFGSQTCGVCCCEGCSCAHCGASAGGGGGGGPPIQNAAAAPPAAANKPPLASFLRNLKNNMSSSNAHSALPDDIPGTCFKACAQSLCAPPRLTLFVRRGAEGHGVPVRSHGRPRRRR
jgi:hypothetical protein